MEGTKLVDNYQFKDTSWMYSCMSEDVIYTFRFIIIIIFLTWVLRALRELDHFPSVCNLLESVTISRMCVISCNYMNEFLESVPRCCL